MRLRPAVGFTIRDWKGLFFDSPKVIKAVDDATYRVFLRFGQYVRKVARHSIRARLGPSAPGEAPHNQTGLLKDFIFYGFDPGSRSVVIGPARLRHLDTYGQVTVPELLEHGGTVQGRDRRMHTYGRRPYMGPAFEAGHEKLPELWANSVR